MIRNAATPLIAIKRCNKVTHALTQLSFRSIQYDHIQPPTRFIGKPKFKSKFKTQAPGGFSEAPKYFLSPYELSQKIKGLCLEGRFDDAVFKLKNSPLDSQNVAVWNTMMVEAFKLNKYQVAYSLFIDMKRRGFTPNIRTYATMLNGLARIDDWHTHSKQLENAHSLFQSYQEYVHGIKAEYPGSRDINVVPWNSYMFILGRAGLHQKLFDTYYLFDNEGPLTPDQYTYTTMFTTLFDRRDTGEIGEGPRAQNASDAKVLWRRMLKDSERLNFPIDSPVIASVLRVLNRGRPSDQLLAFDIVREYLGFCKPGEPPTEPKVPLNLILFQIVLELCNYSRKFRLCIHWTQLIMDKAMDPRSPESEILARSHMEQMFTAYASMAAMGSLNESEQALEALQWMIKESVIGSKPPGQLKPSLHTFGLVMMACWRCGDWASASRTFELVTGLSAESFKDGGNYNPPMKLGGQGLTPNSVVTSSMVRAAVASGDLANMRQCLRMVSYYGEEAIFSIGKDLLTDQSKRHTKRLKKDHVFYNTKLAYALVDCVNQVIPKSNAEEPEEEEGNSSIDAEEKEQWLALRSKAKEIAKGDPRTGYVPGLEQQILGSARGLAATDSRIDFTMMSRTGRGQNRRM